MFLSGQGWSYDKNGIIKSNSIDTVYLKMNQPTFHNKPNFNLYEAYYYEVQKFRTDQWATVFNGVFFGLLLILLITAIYFYFKLKYKYLLWYIYYVILLAIYMWRDFEYDNYFFEFSHSYISWDMGQFPIGLLIFLFYTLFLQSFLPDYNHNKIINHTTKTLAYILYYIYPVRGHLKTEFFLCFQNIYLFIWSSKRNIPILCTIKIRTCSSIKSFKSYITRRNISIYRLDMYIYF